jgi:hypothetical protein
MAFGTAGVAGVFQRFFSPLRAVALIARVPLPVLHGVPFALEGYTPDAKGY